jgi:hypothetical protein
VTGASLADLARRVRRLPAFGRLGPEAVAEERDDIAAELLRLARAAPRPAAAVTNPVGARDPAPVQPPGPRLAQEQTRRLEALARAQATEIAGLRRLLAAAVPRRPRRARADGRQLELPWLP